MEPTAELVELSTATPTHSRLNSKLLAGVSSPVSVAGAPPAGARPLSPNTLTASKSSPLSGTNTFPVDSSTARPVGRSKGPKLWRYVAGEAHALALPNANSTSAAHNDTSVARTGRRKTTALLDMTRPPERAPTAEA